MTRIGRFAPSPTGPLHAGSLVAALASWLDVRAQGPDARWLVRIEDADTERCLPAMGEVILSQLAACALLPDEPPVWQTQRAHRYEVALDKLKAAALAYPCGCSRKDIDEALARLGVAHTRHGERVYPGTCRDGLHAKAARAWRFAATKFQQVSAEPLVHWHDRRLGDQQQDVAHEVGDFVLKRADGPWAYQLAVVVDDAEQGVTDVVRGEDLADNTARQILLQRALGVPTPRYLHTPLVLGPDGDKLSKQNGATALQAGTPAEALAALDAAAQQLGLRATNAGSATEALAEWVPQWRDLYNSRP
ncbi:tRNA glutamyl-Q(34) synthetase GluQRS [Variovorax sp. Sphag1AA]|uniref:tRNA glutamyl-Q(34) synthetase GluQRS n=1 Tax=Variovorax sp. Sphag1AA TaxID=2587027 RepID=UPI00161B1B69|nr:tRNA glutamyl-Q(34) synthetase GluQRS [Variovorax sp. Sphag1AA]MBB3175953.1 glutamyl-Q tRNA(Asp) synthetase [Variovorax sp. Sphag1AA]